METKRSGDSALMSTMTSLWSFVSVVAICPAVPPDRNPLLGGLMDQLLTVEQVAELLSVSQRTVRRLGIPTIRLGRLVRYRATDVARFVEARRH